MFSKRALQFDERLFFGIIAITVLVILTYMGLAIHALQPEQNAVVAQERFFKFEGPTLYINTGLYFFTLILGVWLKAKYGTSRYLWIGWSVLVSILFISCFVLQPIYWKYFHPHDGTANGALNLLFMMAVFMALCGTGFGFLVGGLIYEYRERKREKANIQ